MLMLARSTRARTGLPVFDMMLVGVGDDGHVGSLYPGRDECLYDKSEAWVLGVAMKDPPGITLTLPVMAGAKEVLIAACGVSEKCAGRTAAQISALCPLLSALCSLPSALPSALPP